MLTASIGAKVTHVTMQKILNTLLWKKRRERFCKTVESVSHEISLHSNTRSEILFYSSDKKEKKKRKKEWGIREVFHWPDFKSGQISSPLSDIYRELPDSPATLIVSGWICQRVLKYHPDDDDDDEKEIKDKIKVLFSYSERFWI